MKCLLKALRYLCASTPYPFISLQLGSVLCQVANALSYPSQAATLEVVWGQIASRANARHVVLNQADLAITLKTQELE